MQIACVDAWPSQGGAGFDYAAVEAFSDFTAAHIGHGAGYRSLGLIRRKLDRRLPAGAVVRIRVLLSAPAAAPAELAAA